MHALRVLEFDIIRERLQYNCETPIGADLAGGLEPAFEAEEVWRLLNQTKECMDLIARHSPPSLGALRDPREVLDRAQKGAVLAGDQIFQIADSLYAMRNLKDAVKARRADYPMLWSCVEFLPEHKRLEDQIFDSLESDGYVKDGASPHLASLRQKKRNASQRIQDRIQSYTTGSTRDLLSDPIYTVRDGRYVIPVKAENKGKIRGIVHDTSSTGATVFIEPEEILQLGNTLREIEAAEKAEEQRILASLSAKAGAVAEEAIPGIEQAGFVDFLLAKAKLGYDLKGTIPQPMQSRGIRIQGGRHPLLDPATVVPLDIEIYAPAVEQSGNPDVQQSASGSVLITGPNTGGKTVAIKTVGLSVLMAQSGIPVPALDVRLGPFTQVWADIGDEQSLQQSLSTFSGHIKNIAAALSGLKRGAIVLLDEIGAGTDPAEGAALARAICLELHRRGAAILASTHYGELKAFAYNTPGFQNAAMEFDVKSLRPTYRLIMGAPGASQALRIAERYGISREVVEMAREGLGEQQQDIASMLEKLDLAQKQARIAQGEADRRLAELKRKEKEADQKLAEARQVRESVHGRAQEAIESALREIRLEAAQLFEEIKRAPDQKAIEKARQGLKELQEVGGDFAKELSPRREPASTPEGIAKGMTVRIDGYNQVGTVVEEPRGTNATVQIGALKMTVLLSSLHPVQPAGHELRRAQPNVQLQRAQTAATEVHLRAMRAEDAERELEKFIDDAVLGGIDRARIVHGKGGGILRKITQDYLRRHPHVKSFHSADASEGGDGVTIVEFR
ncbi:MAG TPA: endonuclease MutS2 [Fimbriimonadaceae bacterium]|nr:endonuclease MutS2 [Fimbriimonadaceae bacterium]